MVVVLCGCGSQKSEEAGPAKSSPEYAIKDAVKRLEAKDYKGFFEHYTPPDALKELRESGQFEKIVAAVETLPELDLRLTTLKRAADVKPEISKDGIWATFKVELKQSDVPDEGAKMAGENPGEALVCYVAMERFGDSWRIAMITEPGDPKPTPSTPRWATKTKTVYESHEKSSESEPEHVPPGKTRKTSVSEIPQPKPDYGRYLPKLPGPRPDSGGFIPPKSSGGFGPTYGPPGKGRTPEKAKTKRRDG